MNQLSIQLSNEAMACGLAVARKRGTDSLAQLIEQLLLESAAETRASAVPAGRARPEPLTADAAGSPTHDASGSTTLGVAQPVPDFVVNPPALTLRRPNAQPAVPLATGLPSSASPLPFLTNRVSPFKASVRALANLAIQYGEWPSLRDFQAKAGHAAREVGLRLQAEDRAAGRRGREKRSVAWPIGANPTSALERYVFAFTIASDDGAASGPLATLGLATLAEDRVVLTRSGWELAAAESPLLDGGEGTLGGAETGILRERLFASRSELGLIAEFVRAVRHAAGVQPRIDELLRSWHPDWTSDHVEAQRSAMIGRLEELGLIQVTGRGSKATVTVTDAMRIDDTTERSAA
jgi:hypothetical protein